MANTWEWRGGLLNTVVGSSEAILFAGPGGSFTTPLLTGNTLGQEGTHVRNVLAGTNGGVLPNCQYIDDTTVGISGSSVDVNSVTTSQCTIRIRLITDTIMGTTNSFFDGYGEDTAQAPGNGNIYLYAFQQGNAAWSDLDYTQSNRLSLTAQTVGKTHDFYVGVSARALAEDVYSNINLRIVTEYYS